MSRTLRIPPHLDQPSCPQSARTAVSPVQQSHDSMAGSCSPVLARSSTTHTPRRSLPHHGADGTAPYPHEWSGNIPNPPTSDLPVGPSCPMATPTSKIG